MIEAKDVAELLEALQRRISRVQPRGRGRKKDDCERWSAYNTLGALATAGRLTFPLRLEKSDRPDFTLKSGFSETGIEVTELVDERLAEAVARANNEPGPGELAYLPESHRAVLQREYYWGSNGSEAQAAWIGALANRIQSKRGHAVKSGFRLFERNWLVIYDNLLPFSGVMTSGALPRVVSQGFELSPFDTLLVLGSSELAVFDGASVEVISAPVIHGAEGSE